VALWFGIGFIGFSIAAAFPFALYPLSLALFAKKRELRSDVSWRRPKLAVCMSAYNEEKVIVAKVESLLAMALAYGPAEIYVYVDGAEDRTAELLRPYIGRIHLTISEKRRGKTAGLNLLVEQSDAPLLAFTDANVEAPHDALVKLADRFADSNVGCVSARLTYDNKDESGVAAAGDAYWSLEEAIKHVESETIGLIGVDGALFMIEREAYERAPEHLIDDLYVSLVALLNGRGAVSELSVVVHERGASRWREEYRRKVRIACQAWRVHAALWPRLKMLPTPQLYGYIAHRVLKWLTPFTVLAAGVCGLGLFVALAGWRPALTATAAALAAGTFGVRFNIPPFRSLAMMLVSLAGVGKGAIEALISNRSYTVWTPAASVRTAVGPSQVSAVSGSTRRLAGEW